MISIQFGINISLLNVCYNSDWPLIAGELSPDTTLDLESHLFTNPLGLRPRGFVNKGFLDLRVVSGDNSCTNGINPSNVLWLEGRHSLRTASPISSCHNVMHQSMYSTPPPTPGDTREWAMKMRGKWGTLIHFVPLGGPSMCGGFYSSMRNVVELTIVASHQHVGRCSRQWNRSGNLITEKNLEGAVWLSANVLLGGSEIY